MESFQVGFRMLPERLMEEYGRDTFRLEADFVGDNQRYVPGVLKEGVAVVAQVLRQRVFGDMEGFADQGQPGSVIMGE